MAPRTLRLEAAPPAIRTANRLGTPAEAELDLNTGEVAFADAFAQGD